jgi:ElaB/YqjD/DUF883 family membrane-anchored ribosome-binding protein
MTARSDRIAESYGPGCGISRSRQATASPQILFLGEKAKSGSVYELRIIWRALCVHSGRIYIILKGGVAMKTEALETITDAGAAAAARMGAGVARVKGVVVDAIEGGVDATQDAVKKGRRSAEDLIDDAEHCVKRHPLNAVAVSFGIGLGLGALINALVSRKVRCGR